MLPPSDFLIIVPRTREVPDMIRAASDFIHACQKLWALSVQLQLGQSAVLDTSGILYTCVLQCWQTAQNDGPQHNTGQCLVADPQLAPQRIKPISCPRITEWRRFNISHRPASVQLLAELSPKNATVFALVTDATRQTTAKTMSVSNGEALSPTFDEVQTISVYIFMFIF